MANLDGALICHVWPSWQIKLITIRLGGLRLPWQNIIDWADPEEQGAVFSQPKAHTSTMKLAGLGVWKDLLLYRVSSPSSIGVSAGRVSVPVSLLRTLITLGSGSNT